MAFLGNPQISLMILIIALVAIIAFIGMVFLLSSANKNTKRIQQEAANIQRDNTSLKVNLKQEQTKNENLRNEYTNEMKELNENYTKGLTDLNTTLAGTIEKSLQGSIEKSLQNTQNVILNASAQRLAECSNEILNNALKALIIPLKNEIKDELSAYTSKVNQTNFESLPYIGKTQSLIGSKGDLRDSQLDFVLESSGLLLGVNYEKQVYLEDTNNEKILLDAVVDFGGGKKVIIDAKCPLTSYMEFTNNNSIENAKNIANDIRKHIQTLSSRNYKNSNENYEYIFMLVPNENMLNIALASDKDLYEYACQVGIFLATPQSLLMALRIVSTSWQNMKAEENTDKMLNLVEKLQTNLMDFIDEYDNFGEKLSSVLNSRADLKDKLISTTSENKLLDEISELKNMALESKNSQIQYMQQDDKEKELAKVSYTKETKDENLQEASQENEQSTASTQSDNYEDGGFGDYQDYLTEFTQKKDEPKPQATIDPEWLYGDNDTQSTSNMVSSTSEQDLMQRYMDAMPSNSTTPNIPAQEVASAPKQDEFVMQTEPAITPVASEPKQDEFVTQPTITDTPTPQKFENIIKQDEFEIQTEPAITNTPASTPQKFENIIKQDEPNIKVEPAISVQDTPTLQKFENIIKKDELDIQLEQGITTPNVAQTAMPNVAQTATPTPTPSVATPTPNTAQANTATPTPNTAQANTATPTPNTAQANTATPTPPNPASQNNKTTSQPAPKAQKKEEITISLD